MLFEVDSLNAGHALRYQRLKNGKRGFKKEKKSRFYNILFNGMYSSVKKWLKQTVFLTCAVVCFRRYLKPLGSPKKRKKET